ncbi:universal stress protein [Archaeoglobus veneficus]|uniref:UspA domain-containing protein n=1 Tax=Archaeoglobus veneficus (strain DSM 11195 / SNP6) TaxID=693661 RepID=F2KN72_ARCVS|nr:universal stress protein [Archaeoglobus veneficus]AEA46173.1 UspA domain-containing protein [Archaeoglobus veneficus SNP6]
MLDRILFPTDFSRYADKTLECGQELIELGVKEVILLHVIEREILEYVDSFAGVSAEDLIRDATKVAEEKLKERTKIVEEMGIKARYVITVGDPVTEIAKVADEENVSAILMGAKGRGMLSTTFLGSVSEGVLRTSKVPVIVTKLKVAEKDGAYYCELALGKMLDRILYATDFSPSSEKLLDYVKGMAGREVVLLHVMEKGEDREEVESKLDSIASQLDRVEKVIAEGKPCKEILRVAKEKGATLIMVGFSGGGIFGSTADCVVRRAEVPVFVGK